MTKELPNTQCQKQIAKAHPSFKISHYLVIMASALAVSINSGCAIKFGRPSPENRDEATYLFRFGQFVEWPSYVFQNSKSPMVIGILGGDPFGAELETIVKNKSVNGHPIVVRR